MGKKHYYEKFDDSVPEEIEHYYNRMVRKEEYNLEKDALGSAILFGDEDDLFPYNYANAIRKIEKEETENNEKRRVIENLYKALEN